MNLPNLLTLSRVAAAPLLVGLLHVPSPGVCLAALAVLLTASLTDLLDGRLARARNQVTTLGTFLDPLADKLLVTAVLVMLVRLGWAPAWVAIVILSREMAVTGVRALAAERGLVMAADRLGKLKTVLQLTALCLLVLQYPTLGFDPVPPGLALLYAALVMTVISGSNYLYFFYKSCLNDTKGHSAGPTA